MANPISTAREANYGSASSLLLDLYRSEFVYDETKHDMSLLENVDERTKQQILSKFRSIDQNTQFGVKISKLSSFMDVFWKIVMAFHDREVVSFPKTRDRLNLMLRDLTSPYRIEFNAIFEVPLMKAVREPTFMFTNEMMRDDIKAQFATIQTHVRKICELVIRDESRVELQVESKVELIADSAAEPQVE